MVEVIACDPFIELYEAFADEPAEDVARVIDMFERKGLALGFPYSSAIRGTVSVLRELRVQSGGHALRLLYAFDHARQAVLLVGGNKTGDGRFYEWPVPLAEGEWAAYLDRTGQRLK